jgi:hypothetical protein
VFIELILGVHIDGETETMGWVIEHPPLSVSGLKISQNHRPVTAGTGLTARERFRFRPVGNRPHSKFSIKKYTNIPKNRSSCHESNCIENFQIFICLVYFAGIRSSTNFLIELLMPKKY